jgi:hypothetical protein
MYTFGLTALAAIAYKLYESHKVTIESLDQQAKANRSALESTNELKEKLEALEAVTKTMPASLKALLGSTKELDAAQLLQAAHLAGEGMAAAQRKILADKDEIGALNSLIAENKLQVEGTKEGTYAHTVAAQALQEHAAKVTALETDIKLQNQSITQAKADIGAYAQGLAGATAQTEKLTKAGEENQKAIEKQAQAVEKLRMGQIKASLDADKAISEMRKDQLEYQIALDKRYQKQEEDERRWFGLAKSNMDQYRSIVSSTFQSAANTVGSAFAKMAVEGKSFAEVTKHLIVTVVEEMIGKFVAMGIEWAAMQAYRAASSATAESAISEQVTAQTGVRTAAVLTGNVKIATSYAAVAEAAAGAFGAMLGPAGSAQAVAEETGIMAPIVAQAAAATGIDFIADKPTFLQVGEGGQGEHVQVTPLSQSGGGGRGGGDTYFEFGDIIVQGVKNPREFADQIALLVIQAIRGRGQISAIGQSIH